MKYLPNMDDVRPICPADNALFIIKVHYCDQKLKNSLKTNRPQYK